MKSSSAFIFGALAMMAAGVFGAGNGKNLIIIHLDDFGYWDTSAISKDHALGRMWYLEKTSKTVNMEKIAADGITFTQWYSPHPVCSPSRASLLSGRYPIRTGVFPGVFDPQSTTGMPHTEETIAEILQKNGYKTFMAGKGHLGHVTVLNKDGTNNTYLPMALGFDRYTGIPWSHDYCPCPASLTLTNDTVCRPTDPGCPLYENFEVIQQPARLFNLTQYYADWVGQRLQEMAASNEPFFLHWTPQHTHHPQFRSAAHINASEHVGARGDNFGDAALEIDEAIGQVMAELVSHENLRENTYVFIASDNGPSLIRYENGGDPGPLRCGKGTTWEGGQRTPAFAWGPGFRKGVEENGIGSTIDLLPTGLSLLGLADQIPKDRAIDGMDLSPVLFGTGPSPRTHFFHYGLSGTLQAVRVGDYKVHYFTSIWGDSPKELCEIPGVPFGNFSEHPLVFNIAKDIGENHPLDNSTDEYKQAVASAAALAKTHNCFNQNDACAGKLTSICSADENEVPPWPPQPFHPFVATCPDKNPHPSQGAQKVVVDPDNYEGDFMNLLSTARFDSVIQHAGQNLTLYSFL